MKENEFNNFTLEQLEDLAKVGIKFTINDGKIIKGEWEAK